MQGSSIPYMIKQAPYSDRKQRRNVFPEWRFPKTAHTLSKIIIPIVFTISIKTLLRQNWLTNWRIGNFLHSGIMQGFVMAPFAVKILPPYIVVITQKISLRNHMKW